MRSTLGAAPQRLLPPFTGTIDVFKLTVDRSANRPISFTTEGAPVARTDAAGDRVEWAAADVEFEVSS